MSNTGISKSKVGLATLATASMLVVLLLTSCNKADNAAGHAAIPEVNAPVSTVEAGIVPGSIELTGTVTGRSSIPLSSKLMSEITMLTVEEGDRVSAGEVLVRLDDSDIRAMRSEAAAYRAEAQAVLSEVAAVKQQATATVSQSEAAIAQAEVALEDAERDLGRFQALYEKSVVSRAELDKVQLGADVARQNLNQARAAKEQALAAVAQAESRNPQVEAREQQAGARDLQAASMQAYATLSAPFDGIVKAKYFEQGQLSVPGQPIIVVEQIANMRVSLAIPDHAAMELATGDTLQVAIDSANGRELRGGHIAVLAASADPASRSVLAEVELDDSNGLLSGQFVRVLVPSGERNVILAPESAVLQDAELYYVWRVSGGGLLTRATVEPGLRMDGKVEILRGLSAGDRIVSEPRPGLFAGARVSGMASPEGH
ncbi:efflux RND transporter periplasmic adaptor subunit [bacterium]|nr:efflux RND transporter periplasmic adaptor subunit [bacterium]